MTYYLIYTIFIISFTKGLFELVGLPETIVQLIIEGLILLLFFIAILNSTKTKKAIIPGFLIFLSLFLTIIISYVLTDVNTLQLALFLRKFGIYIMFFYSLFNVQLTQIQKDKLFSLLVFLFLIQIPAAFIKLFVLGGTFEKIVGTMSVMEGSLATVMPLFPIAYLISSYLEYKKFKYIILILLFMSISLMSNKLGIIFYVILLFFFLSYLYSRPQYYIPNFKFMKKFTISSFYLIIIFSLYVTLNPHANPEHKVGGSIDMDYLINFTKDYQILDLKTGVEGDGRFDAPFVALDRLYNGGTINVLFGFGPGDIVQSSFTQYDNPLLEKYNIGYGGRLGFVWMIMQIGILGTALFVIFHIYLFKRVLNIYQKNTYKAQSKLLILTVLGFCLIFFLDFFTYSAVLIHSTGITLTYFFAIYYILSSYEHKKFVITDSYNSKKYHTKDSIEY